METERDTTPSTERRLPAMEIRDQPPNTGGTNPYASVTICLLIILSSVLLAFPSILLGLILFTTKVFQGELSDSYINFLRASDVVYGGKLNFITTLFSSIPALISAIQINKYRTFSKCIIFFMFILLIFVVSSSAIEMVLIHMEGDIEKTLKMSEHKHYIISLYLYVQKNFHLAISYIGIITGIGIFKERNRK